MRKFKLKDIDYDLMKHLKQCGFSDFQIAQNTNAEELEVRSYRKSLNVIPVVKQIDTMAAEFPAQTNYLYLTYHGVEDDIHSEKKIK